MNTEYTSKHFTLEKVKSGIYAATSLPGGGAVGNAGFIDLGDHTLVFDTFNTQQAAKELKMFATEVTNKNVTWVVNSHWHGDHIRGNQIFKDSTIIASHITYEKMKVIHPSRIDSQKSGIEDLSGYIASLRDRLASFYEKALEEEIGFLSEIESSLPTLELTLPHQTFKEELTFYGTQRSAKLYTYGGGHSFCDSFLYIPEERTIFMGDLLFCRTHPSILEDSNPENWIRILHRIKEFDFEIAISGHGPVGTKQNVLELIEYMEGIMEVSEEEGEYTIPEKYKQWSSSEQYHRNIKRIRENTSR